MEAVEINTEFSLEQAYFRDILDEPLLTREEEVELAKRIEKGDERAREKLINSNLRLVISMAKNYNTDEYTLMDLIQEGNIGLMKAVEKYDYKLGYKFSTYAVWWIKQSINRAISSQMKTIRFPAYYVENMLKVIEVRDKLLQELGREPLFEEVAEETKLKADKVEEILFWTSDPLSLEAPRTLDGVILKDLLMDEETDVEGSVLEESTYEEIKLLLDTLSEQEKRVIIKRFGLDTDKPMTLEEVSKEEGVTRESIRQIEKKALRKMNVIARSFELQ